MRQIENFLLMLGAWVFKVHGHLGQRPGVPDLLCCLDGRLVAIEVKTERGKPTERQLREIEGIRASGGVAFIARSVEEVYEQLKLAGFDLPVRL